MDTKRDKEVQYCESEVIITKVDIDNWQKVIVDGVEGVVFGCIDTLIENAVFNDAISGSDASGVNCSATFLSVNNDSHIIVDDCIKVAKTVDKTSFSRAFAMAREQIGVGGVFVWFGNMYGTFNAEEWDDLTIEQRDKYTSHINYYDALIHNVITQESKSNESNDEEEDGFDLDDDIDLDSDSDSEVEVISVEEENEVQIIAVNNEGCYDYLNSVELHSNEEDVLIIVEDNDIIDFSNDDTLTMMELDQDYHIINADILDSNMDSCDIV